MIKISVITSLYRGGNYLQSYLEHVKRITNPDEVEILLLHNDPTLEELNIIRNNINDIPFIKHIIIPEREGLYATWNRGVKLAQGEYCAIWNVDDVRTSDSLVLQAKCLDENKDADITYGKFMSVYQYGDINGDLIDDPDFTPSIAKERHLIGCFPMWRKSIHEKIGYFDEQFKLVADFEFQIRASFFCKIAKVKGGFLGYYLEGVSDKLSSNKQQQMLEQSKIDIRYGFYSQMDLCYVFFKYKFKTSSILSGQKKYAISTFIPQIHKYKLSHSPLIIIAILRFPYCLARYLKHKLFN